MENLLQEPLFSIIKQSPATVAVLEKFHVDYCHFSKKTLAEVCTMQQVPTEALAQAIQQVLLLQPNHTINDVSTMSLTELITYIQNNYHAYLKNQLPVILKQLEKTVQKHGEKFSFLLDVFFFFELWKDEMTTHLIYEESKLFPVIMALEKQSYPTDGFIDTATLEHLLRILEKEHEHSDDLMEKIKTLTQDFTASPQNCKAVQLSFAALKHLYQNLQEHLQIENNLLIPKAKKIALHKRNTHNKNNSRLT